ncbi:predicted protein [Methanosarcina acetivorans C2A]|uniref:Uncharacterized protein n=1 Tax=Methanosarcina acetivorans (strain ATCC 35395 / DSM 2834 / JCM 12185 / C2A) TaxID=188937 RepID=Q8TRC6_METAC|nr:predicted protein [Methanosarcina acetivorans C2A]
MPAAAPVRTSTATGYSANFSFCGSSNISLRIFTVFLLTFGFYFDFNSNFISDLLQHLDVIFSYLTAIKTCFLQYR